ncbi:MAG: T9SS type A sorting domain-containing protein, partial [Bacteroidota bacterium]
DVGQDDFEEVNIITLGGNYGWRLKEGPACFNPPSGCQTGIFEEPVFTYDHDEGLSITGGYVQRVEGSTLYGQYLYADYVTGRLYALDAITFENRLLLETGGLVSAFGQDESGEVYLLAYDTGAIFRIAAPVSGVGTEPELPASVARVSSIFPQPADQEVTFTFELDEPGQLDLAVYDALGRRVATLVQGAEPAGTQSVVFNREDLPAGVYVAVLLMSGQRQDVRQFVVQ